MITTHRMRLEITQEGNTDGTTGEYEDMTIEIEGMWMDDTGRGYAVLRTEGWSVECGAEMAQIIDAAQDAAQAVTEKLRSFSVTEVAKSDAN